VEALRRAAFKMDRIGAHGFSAKPVLPDNPALNSNTLPQSGHSRKPEVVAAIKFLRTTGDAEDKRLRISRFPLCPPCSLWLNPAFPPNLLDNKQ
jgi:hypothetical protein